MNMQKNILLILIVLLPFYSYRATAQYNLSLMGTNPLGILSKEGGALEFRTGKSSFMIAVTNYTGVYEGKQYRFEYQKYFHTKLSDNFFWYIKAGGGQSTYNGKALSFLDDKSTGATPVPVDYYLGGAGFGRRVVYKHFCLSFTLGLKYSNLPADMSDENKESYRLFYATGPGSIIDANIRFGFQF